MANPRVFFDVAVDDGPAKRIVMELFADIVPKTAENFRALCTGEKGFGYKGSKFHQCVPGEKLEGGDFEKGNGSGGRSIYGKYFDDENFMLRHHTGSLSMASSGPNTNASQFCTMISAASWRDGKHVVFGRVIDGMETVVAVALQNFGPGSAIRPNVVITDCGQLPS
jgi:cyclophilin family peptidyl-prolyl cis-trans isomerase